MSGLVVRVIIWRGALSTHNLFWMRGGLPTVVICRSIPLVLCMRSRRRRRRRRSRSRAIGIRVRIARLWGSIVAGWWIPRIHWSERLAVSAIQHGRVSIARVSALLRTVVALRVGTARRTRLWTIDSRSRDKGTLRRHRVEEALLVEADTVLAPAFRRALVARATDLRRAHQLSSTTRRQYLRPTFLLRQYLHAMAVR